MIGHLDLDNETLKIKDKKRAYWEQFSAWRKGFKSGKKGDSSHDNPYKLTPEIYKLLQKRARWKIGYDEGDAIRHRRVLAKQKRKHKKEKKHHGREKYKSSQRSKKNHRSHKNR